MPLKAMTPLNARISIDAFDHAPWRAFRPGVAGGNSGGSYVTGNSSAAS